jgi:ubiquitin-conjugating enzyme E2 O
MSEDGRKNCSTGFKIMLGKLLPKLATTFTEAGIVGSQ